jgi:hypothetical protein
MISQPQKHGAAHGRFVVSVECGKVPERTARTTRPLRCFDSDGGRKANSECAKSTAAMPLLLAPNLAVLSIKQMLCSSLNAL